MKQINLRSTIMIQYFKYAVVALLAILVFNWFKSCLSEPIKTKPQTVIVPEVKGTFEPKKPESKPLKIMQNPIPETKKDGIVYISNPLNEKLIRQNDSLKKAYLKMSDSLKLKEFEKAIELNNFSSKFEDDNLILNVNGIVRGEVQEITPNYTIKERKINVIPKETVFRLLAGSKIQTSIITPKFNIEANLMFQNKRGDIISTGYSNKNLNPLNEDVWSVGYYRSIFSVKR